MERTDGKDTELHSQRDTDACVTAFVHRCCNQDCDLDQDEECDKAGGLQMAGFAPEIPPCNARGKRRPAGQEGEKSMPKSAGNTGRPGGPRGDLRQYLALREYDESGDADGDQKP